MNFFNRLFRSTRPSARPAAKRRPNVARREGLQLEFLEDRWAPAIDVTGQGTASVVINDVGADSSAIEIIDDYDTSTTYIRINGQGEQVLGLSGTLLANLDVNMGAGNDKVTFSVRGTTNPPGAALNRTIDLGAGNDTLNVNLGLSSLGNVTTTFTIDGDTSGNDKYFVAGVATSGVFVFDAATTDEASGNDTYNFSLTARSTASVTINIDDVSGKDVYIGAIHAAATLNPLAITINETDGNDSYNFQVSGATAAAISLDLNDQAGADKYTLAVNASHNASLAIDVDDLGFGKNSVKFSQGALLSVAQLLDLNFDSSASNNTVAISGNALIENSDLDFMIASNGISRVTIDDNVLVESSTHDIVFALAAFNDKVNVKLDGRRTGLAAGISSGSQMNISGVLGDGNDSFAVAVNRTYFKVNDDIGLATGLDIDIDAGAGNDKLSIGGSGRAALSLLGSNALVDVRFLGGIGNDSISLNVGSLAVAGASSIGARGFNFDIDAGIGADKVSLAGTLTGAEANMLLSGIVNLGLDAEKDSLTSTFRAASSVALPILGSVDFRFSNFLATDVTKFSTAVSAPIWTQII